MAYIVNTSATTIYSMYKYYHTDDTRFYTAANTDEYPDEMYAVTIHSSVTTSQTIHRFVKSSGGTWKNGNLLDPTATANQACEIKGVEYGDLARSNEKVYYSNYIDTVKQIRPRRSAGDTWANYVWEAGLPDPNAVKVIAQCDETAGWTFDEGANGTGSSSMDYSPLRRTEGRGMIWFSQRQGGQSSTLTYSITAITSAVMDLNTFSDGTTAANTDYIAFEVFRFLKNPISQLWIDISNTAGFSKYFTAPVTVTPDLTADADNTTETWDNFNWQMFSAVAKWAMNPYDNQLFSVRINRNWFAKCGAITWSADGSAISHIRFRLIADGEASATNQAKVGIDNIRLLKNPGFTRPFRIQFADCEESESGSTTGWETNEATGAKASFNKWATKNGVSAINVTPRAALGGSATVTLRFDTPKNLAVFPDGTTATTSDVLKVNMMWLGFASGLTIDFTGLTDFSPPIIVFTDSLGETAEAPLFSTSDMEGGGGIKQVPFNMNAAYWTLSNPFTWSSVSKIGIKGAWWIVGTPPNFIIDDIRLERPTAQQAVNLFEPIDLYILDNVTQFLSAGLGEYAWVAEALGGAFKGVMSWSKLQTYGMGHAIYPDYEHSAMGLSCLRLIAYGSKPFGAVIYHNIINPTDAVDLTQYIIPRINWPPTWNLDDAWGPIAFDTIPAGPNDRFEIWLASPPEGILQVKELKIRLHGNDGVGGLDRKNYWEKSISGQELGWSLHKSATEQQEAAYWAQAYGDNISKWSEHDLATRIRWGNNPNSANYLNQYKEQMTKLSGVDRGGWASAVYSWKKKDFILVHDGESGVAPSLTDIKGISFELTADTGGCQVAIDNFMMIKEGSLTGTYYYKTVLEDMEGYLSPSTEASIPVRADKQDVVLTNIYVPNNRDKKRVHNKRIYRLGGGSSEWRHVGDLDVEKTEFVDNVIEENLGLVLPPDAYAPPRAKIMKAIGNNMYYANVQTRLREKFPYRVYVSEAFAPFRVSDFACIDIPETKGSGITGLESYYGHIVIWTPDSMWTEPMGLGQVPIKRADIGCVAKRSVCRTDFGLVWMSKDGLVLGDISRVDTKFFEPVNELFSSFTEKQLENTICYYDNKYLYCFYDPDNGKGIACYMPGRQFTELTGTFTTNGTALKTFDVRSICIWDGGSDNSDVYAGRSDGRIMKLFSGDKDDSSSITSTLRTMNFSHPGHQFDKSLRAAYLSVAKLGSDDVTIVPTVWADESSIDTMPTITATVTTVKTYVSKAVQGDYGTHLGLKLVSTNRNKISQVTLKIAVEEDTEYLP